MNMVSCVELFDLLDLASIFLTVSEKGVLKIWQTGYFWFGLFWCIIKIYCNNLFRELDGSHEHSTSSSETFLELDTTFVRPLPTTRQEEQQKKTHTRRAHFWRTFWKSIHEEHTRGNTQLFWDETFSYDFSFVVTANIKSFLLLRQRQDNFKKTFRKW